MSLTDDLVKGYMRSMWTNQRRSINEFQAREELLGAGRIYSYEVGSTNPAVTYQDDGRTTANANPVILSAYGELVSKVILPESGADLKVCDRWGNPVASFANLGHDTVV